MGLTKAQKVVFVLVMVIVLLWVWSIFPVIFNWVMFGIGSKETSLKDLGPLGDIYGSLNTLFTSATLIIVIYSTILQREANEDTRKAMQEELQLAKDLSKIQLDQSRQAAQEQLDLVRETHAAQIKENQYNFFTNQFYALLNLKENKFYKLRVDIKNQYYEQDQIFVKLSGELSKILQELEDDLSLDYFEKKFLEYVDSNKTDTSDQIFSYFLIYTSLINLVQNSCLEDYEKQTYYEILSNSMRLPEQVVFFWISCFIPRFRECFKNIILYLQFYDDIYLDMAYNLLDREYFSADWQHKFNEIDFILNNPD